MLDIQSNTTRIAQRSLAREAAVQYTFFGILSNDSVAIVTHKDAGQHGMIGNAKRVAELLLTDLKQRKSLGRKDGDAVVHGITDDDVALAIRR